MTAIKDLMLETFEVSKVLIIAPLRVARDTWPAEIEKWDHLQGLDISVIVGDTKTRIAALHHPAMIYVINRENIKWLVEYYEKNGMRWDFGMVVIDELSSFKNYQSQRFKFLRKVRPYVKRWVGLTGTPSSNGLMDLWAEIGILDGGERLGKFIGRYREAYFKASSMNPSTGVVFQYKPREGAEELIYQRISDITISMKALDYLHMPDCIPSRYEVEMSAPERELYDMLRKNLLIPLKDGDIDAANAASLTGKLLQMSNGAVYDENGKARIIHDHKLEALEDLIEAANGQPVLVAYWFKHDRQRIMEHLAKQKIPVRDIKSSTDIKDWNAGKIPVALIHPASAGHGLNIQQGDGVNEDVCFTLDATDRHAVCAPEDVYAMTTGSYMQVAKEVAPTLMARDYKDPTTIAPAPHLNEGVAGTVATGAHPSGFNGQDAFNDRLVIDNPEAQSTPVTYTVRRLTPTECARLQGFPDWWCRDLGTENPTEEELAFWTDVFETHRKIVTHAKKPKTEKQIRKWLADPYTDSAEYRIWGNGICLANAFFVLAGIAWCAGLEE